MRSDLRYQSSSYADFTGARGMKIVIASNNGGKLRELQTMFAPLGCELVCQGELGVPEAPEPHCLCRERSGQARNAA